MATLGQVKLKQQIAHLKPHQAKLMERVGYKTVEEYFRMYVGSHPDLYERCCQFLGIEPRVK